MLVSHSSVQNQYPPSVQVNLVLFLRQQQSSSVKLPWHLQGLPSLGQKPTPGPPRLEQGGSHCLPAATEKYMHTYFMGLLPPTEQLNYKIIKSLRTLYDYKKNQKELYPRCLARSCRQKRICN